MADTNDIKSYLFFSLGNNEFAINAGKIQRILDMRDITPLPQSPVYMMGVIDMDGEALPVIDTHIKLDVARPGNHKKEFVIVVEIGSADDENCLGIIADKVHSVTEVEPDNIKMLPDNVAVSNASYIGGMIENNGRFIVILNPDAILTSDDIVAINKLVADYTEALSNAANKQQ